MQTALKGQEYFFFFFLNSESKYAYITIYIGTSLVSCEPSNTTFYLQA